MHLSERDHKGGNLSLKASWRICRMPASPRALSPGSGIVMPYVAVHHPEKCHRYGICSEIVDCPGADDVICIGVGLMF